MRQIMLDRGTTFSLILLILVKPALALVNFLYVMCVMLPLFVTGIIFCIPAGIHGPVLSLLQGYAGFMARRLCEFDEDTQEVVEVEERDVEVLAEVEDLERAPVGRLVEY
ncbi:hypothetical protein BC829DRAFT_247452 [Chytridium lagenaria]|nr:hypothetical protein BC829DRAFT_247452 [Chytridium lagenaria]